MIVRLFAIYLFSVSLTSCHQDKSSNPHSEAEVNAIDVEQVFPDEIVTYAIHIKPIIEKHCISCHDEAAAEANGKPDSDFTNFTGARPYGSLMPTFRLFNELSGGEQQTINSWIDNGLTEADYLAGVKTILDTHCISCHTEEAPKRKGLPKTNLKIESTVKLYGSQIPSFGKLKEVSHDEQLILEEWVRDGLQ